MAPPDEPAVRLPSARFLGRALAACVAVLLLLHVVVLVAHYGYGRPYVFGLADRFDMDREGTVPTFFTVILLFGSALLAALHAGIERARGGAHVVAWTLVAVAAAWLGFDDGAELHELASGRVRPLVSDRAAVGMALAVAGGAALLLVAWRARPFLSSLPARRRNALAVAAALYLFGTVALEVAGWEVWRAYGLESLGFAILATVEEVLEMTAAILFLCTLRALLADREREIRLVVED